MNVPLKLPWYTPNLEQLACLPSEHAGAGAVRDRLFPPLRPGGFREVCVRFGSACYDNICWVGCWVGCLGGRAAGSPTGGGRIPFFEATGSGSQAPAQD